MGRRLTHQTFMQAYNATPSVTRQQVVDLGYTKFGFSSEYMKLIIGTTQREGYPLDPYLFYEWASCITDYRVMNYNSAFATDAGAYATINQWPPFDEQTGESYYSYRNIQNGYDTVTEQVLKCVYLAITNLDKNTIACSGGPYAGCYIYYQSAEYPDIMVWYRSGVPIIDGGIEFTERTSSPAGSYNPCYMTNGGPNALGYVAYNSWNTCITGEWEQQGLPNYGQPSAGANALPNCTGYAQGRSIEIYNECMNYNPNTTLTHPFIALNQNAGEWYDIAQTVGIQVNPTVPAPGSIMCWGKYNDAGHVEVVEKVIDNDTVVTTGSAYGAWAFGADWCSMTRVRGDGNWLQGTMWGMPNSYYFRGFILNPADPDQPIPPIPPTPTHDKSKLWMYMKRRDLRPQYRF